MATINGKNHIQSLFTASTTPSALSQSSTATLSDVLIEFEQLKSAAIAANNTNTNVANQSTFFTAEFAAYLDSIDSLSVYRSEFAIPTVNSIHSYAAQTAAESIINTELTQSKSVQPPVTITETNKNNNTTVINISNTTTNGTTIKDEEIVYLCGNSLGLQPLRSAQYINEEMLKWRSVGVEGHFLGQRPWARIDEKSTELAAGLIGSTDLNELAILNSLSVNLHLLLISFYRPNKNRFKILIEAAAFCSDHHVVRSQLDLHGLTEEDALIQLQPRLGEYSLRNEDIITAINNAGDSLAVVLLPGIQFYTGQLFDISAITTAAHTVGSYAGFDLAHTVGNIPLKLNEWNVDFAAWCSYKYLNSGPGSIAGLFIHQQHHSMTLDSSWKRLSGWWGQTAEARFSMKSIHQPKPGAQSYMLSNPAVLPTVCVQASLELFHSADIYRLREKSLRLTAFLQLGIELLLQSKARSEQLIVSVEIITPRLLSERGCQLSLLFNCPAKAILHELEHFGVIADLRHPDVIRISPAPLYNSFTDVFNCINRLYTVMKHHKPIITYNNSNNSQLSQQLNQCNSCDRIE